MPGLCYGIIHIILVKDTGGKGDSLALQSPVNRNPASVSAYDKYLRLTLHRFHLQAAKFRIIAAFGDSVQPGNIGGGENLFRSSAPLNVFPLYAAI